MLHPAAILGLLLGVYAMRSGAGSEVRMHRQPATGLAGLGLLLAHVSLLATYNIAPAGPKVKEEVVKKMSRRADEEMNRKEHQGAPANCVSGDREVTDG